MANKTPKFTIRKVPQTVAEWQDIVRYLNKLVEGTELAAAIQTHDEAADAHPSAFAAHNADADAHPLLAVPVGATIPFAGETLPDGFLFADGSAVSRTTYARLFNAIGTLYGAGDGSTTFNLPNIPDLPT